MRGRGLANHLLLQISKSAIIFATTHPRLAADVGARPERSCVLGNAARVMWSNGSEAAHKGSHYAQRPHPYWRWRRRRGSGHEWTRTRSLDGNRRVRGIWSLELVCNGLCSEKNCEIAQNTRRSLLSRRIQTKFGFKQEKMASEQDSAHCYQSSAHRRHATV